MITDTFSLIYQALGNNNPGPSDGKEDCFWCGIRPGVHKKSKIIGSNFTNLDRARSSKSKKIISE